MKSVRLEKRFVLIYIHIHIFGTQQKQIWALNMHNVLQRNLQHACTSMYMLHRPNSSALLTDDWKVTDD